MPEQKSPVDPMDHMTPIEVGRAAVLVVDVQNDYCHPNGAIASGQDFALMERILQPHATLLKAATEAGLLIVFIRATVSVGHVNESPARLHLKARTLPEYAIHTLDYVVEGTWGHDVVDVLKTLAPDAVHVFKSRNGAFVNTNLDLILRSNGVDTVIVTGMATDGCVAATARGAEDHGYRCLVVRDCVSSFKPDLHEHALKVLGSRMEVVRVADILHLLKPPAVIPHRAPSAAKTSQGA